MTLRIGFIGVGGIAEVHIRNIAGLEEAKVAAMYDVNPQRLDEMARRYDCSAYSDLEQMLAQEELDAVYICVPPFAHGDIEFTVLAHGIPMFIEKPISIGEEPARQILQTIEERQALVAVGYHWRYAQAARLAKQALAEHTPGMMQGYWFGGMPMVPWWRKMDTSGGQMVEQTTHIVDLARYLVGNVTEVYAVYAQRGMQDIVDGVTVPDVGSMTLRFENGAIGTISNTCLLNQGYTVGLDILTRDVIYEVRSDGLTERTAHQTTFRRNPENAYLIEDKAFLAAIQSGDASKILSPYADAFLTQRVTAAANQSAETGRPVRLD
ncbi:MAG: Gfo/Idh/MocA family oxidoreductase [Alicyclobacillus herbarius]|uniref:Gfo/Idh/MocA family protein n=1 Tax=Alicyclobacillus herbarius TaxID=122960 RepID=UPI0023576404|nr:Gfo/Idh/MocA family oxidoreductase [Alicyclobacillus herbarius]MCL6631840.1 Gfo/Idh/MocA family oxidoreductase [Alicyclobacillus herbarius]